MGGGPSALRPIVVQLTTRGRLPEWLRRPIAGNGVTEQVRDLLTVESLHTVCQSARCPNVSECFGQGTATFMIAGDICTRSCSFCAVPHGVPLPLETDEGARIGAMAQALRLDYVVVTAVARDDLADGGASHFAGVVRQIRAVVPHMKVEVLVPDFQGRLQDVETVLAAAPDVFNHNVETIARLQQRVRPAAQYERSLHVLSWASERGCVTKSGMMVGLGEREAEVEAACRDLRRAGCDLLTIGQYLQPIARRLPVAEFVTPEQFVRYREMALGLGFVHVASGPYVRSSYRAAEGWRAALAARALASVEGLS